MFWMLLYGMLQAPALIHTFFFDSIQTYIEQIQAKITHFLALVGLFNPIELSLCTCQTYITNVKCTQLQGAFTLAVLRQFLYAIFEAKIRSRFKKKTKNKKQGRDELRAFFFAFWFWIRMCFPKTTLAHFGFGSGFIF